MTFKITKATPSDYPSIVRLIQSVWDRLEQKAWFAADNSDYTIQMLETGQGLAFKATEQETGELAGIFMIVFPGLSQENLGRDINLPESELVKVVHMDSAAVLPEYRGYSLQRRLMQAAEAEARRRGFRYLMCTIHPDNHYSRDNVLEQGYHIAATKEKYGGYIRNILIKELEAV
ncbi:GNAT family N-acetyltransferase [Clostridium sp. MCC353]|uniref:GNAT family N-acetyltransferase n=1 Tax=Clostridium sp. MCC353 TaxID=2592646 RepID=UPI001C00E286|nr:GNAT family N-acetyltransferase [Clostridium sp. MCC353]MBT9776246.1 GNAT family N-acetyltransferase [Clostridium sp. MCC353]